MIILVIYEWLELFHKVRNVLLFTVIFIFFFHFEFVHKAAIAILEMKIAFQRPQSCMWELCKDATWVFELLIAFQMRKGGL